MTLQSSDSRTGFEKKLAAYALAGGAMLAAPDAVSAATIVTTPSEPIRISIPEEGNDFWDLDVDNDGTIDISFYASVGIDDEGVPISFVGATAEGIAAECSCYPYKLRAYENPTLPGPGSYLSSYGYLLHRADPIDNNGKSYGPFFYGNWPNDLRQSRFLAFQFFRNGQLTGGWVQVAVQLGSADFELQSWAYDDGAVPEPSSLALFAAGAAGIAALRRKRGQSIRS